MAKREFQLCLLLSSSHNEMVYDICHIMFLMLCCWSLHHLPPFSLSLSNFSYPSIRSSDCCILILTTTPLQTALNHPWGKKNKDIKSWNWIFNEVTTATHIGSAGGPLTNGMIHAAAECFQHPPLGQSLGNQRARRFGLSPQVTSMWVVPFISCLPSSYEKLTYRTKNKASIIMKKISPIEKH